MCTRKSEKPQHWTWWCRLCAKDDAEGNTNIFCKYEQAHLDPTLATAIGKYFWVNIKQNDELSKFLCYKCMTLVTSLITFTERVNKVQAMFCMLQNSKEPFDATQVKMQYNLLDEDFVHIINNKEDDIHGRELIINISDEKQELPDDETVQHIELELEETENIAEELETESSPLSVESDAEHFSLSEEINYEFFDNEAMQLKCIREKEMLDDSEADEEDDRASISVREDDRDFKEIEITAKPVEVFNKNEDENENESEIGDNEICNDKETECEEQEKNSKTLTATNECSAPMKLSTSTRKRGRPSATSNKVLEIKRSITANDMSEPVDATSTSADAGARYTCSVCSRKYKNLTSYRKHMKDAHKTEPDIPEYNCENCERTFPSEKQLANHARSHLPLNEKLDVPCPFCDKKFTKLSVMKQHVSGLHYNEKPFICDECGRGLRTFAALNEHKLVHTNECPFECSVCGKRFKNKPRLKIHAETHTEASHICNVCGMQLNTRRTLKMHMLVHSDDRQYTCNFCNAGFKRCKALKNHLLLHSGLRPYKCNFCDKTFANGSNCRSHKKKSHPQELAKEEALGKKPEPIAVPRLSELRASKSFVDTPREVKRAGAGGLALQVRELLINAEKRKAKAKMRGMKMEEGDNELHIIELDDYELEEQGEYEIEDKDADNDEETIVYEIINDI